MPVRIVVAEDSYLLREALTQLLKSDPGLHLADMVADAPSLIEAIDREQPDVVVTDIQMPPFERAEGIEVAAQLRQAHPQIGVVVLSQYAEPSYALDLFELGSSRRAYLLKERIGNRAELTAAIHAVAGGGSMIDPKIVDLLIAERLRSERSLVGSLTTRETEVLAEVATGKSNSAIADSLCLTKHAVEKHINSIFSKLELGAPGDVSRRVEATLIYLADETRPSSPP